MKQFLHFSVFICGLVLFHFEAQAQDPYNDITQNRPAIKNLTADGIRDLIEKNPVELEKMKYLFTRSFDVELIDCSSCEIDYVDLFNISLFDVTEYSSVRLRNEVYEFDFKNKYHITLHSDKEILLNYTAIESSFNTEKVSSEAPKFLLKGDLVASYSDYKVELDQFKRSNREAYEAMIENNNVLKISAEEFLSFPEAKRESVLNHSNGYLIIE